MACHQEDFEAPKVLDHVALGFPEDCLSCHTPFSWNDVADFDHVAFSGGYELQGVHGELPCSGCHLPGGGLRFPTPAGPQDCYSCHQADYQREHGGEGYPTTCSMCHSQTSWEGADDDHAVLSNGFVLEGAHQELACTSCHVPGGTAALFHPLGPQDCVACHQADYQREHTGSGYPTACTTCHSTATWEGGNGDHGLLSGGFVLVGEHGQLDCTSCHLLPGMEGIFSPSDPEDCLACHLADFQREHPEGGYPGTCLTCHVVTSWEGAHVDHAALSEGFVLEGAHGELACVSCHTADGVGTLFQPAGPDDCVSCHQDDYQREHAGSGYPLECLTCHTVTVWTEVTADHGLLSNGFVLVGNHGQLDCSACHLLPGMESIFSPADAEDCLACHLADYQREHSGTGYPETCLTCHVVTTWEGAQADHAALSDGFVLEGAHTGLACVSCHTADLSGTLFQPNGPDDCVSCHQDDYQREHSGSGYPTDCLTCHTVVSWQGAEFNHDGAFFPIYSGPHQGRWSDCSVCHTDPTNLGTFTCLSCHEHNKTQTDADHSQVRDDVYESGQCYSCHPTGRSKG